MTDQNSSVYPLFWKGTAGIEQAILLKKELLDAFKKQRTVSLDISEVEDIDISALQIILAAVKEAEKKSGNFYITGTIPDNIRKIIQTVHIPFPLQKTTEDTHV
jgi:anti-anti-sigma regulatory factor